MVGNIRFERAVDPMKKVAALFGINRSNIEQY